MTTNASDWSAYNPVVRIPKRLESNPLLEVIAEVRFESDLPPDAILGIVYGALQNQFGKPENLPILQLPAKMREVDPNLRYQACYRFNSDGHYLLLGPRMVALATTPYRDWDSAAPSLNTLFSKLEKVGLFRRVERTGLRYINFFDSVNIFEHVTLALEISGKSLATQNITLRTEHDEGEFLIIRQLINRASTEGEKARNGSVFDIDVICQKFVPTGSLTESLLKVLTASNAVADDIFFSMLKPEFVQRFKPVY